MWNSAQKLHTVFMPKQKERVERKQIKRKATGLCHLIVTFTNVPIPSKS